MFGSLTEKFQQMFSGLTGKKTLTEDNISDAVRQVRLALLDADVNYSVASNFVKRVKEKAVGDAVIKSVSPGQQFIKFVHEELVALMGTEESPLELKGKSQCHPALRSARFRKNDALRQTRRLFAKKTSRINALCSPPAICSARSDRTTQETRVPNRCSCLFHRWREKSRPRRQRSLAESQEGRI